MLITYPGKTSAEGIIEEMASSDSGEEYNPNGPDTVESEDDESCALDDSETDKESVKGKKKMKFSQGSLRAAVHAAQGKNVLENRLTKRKASESDE